MILCSGLIFSHFCINISGAKQQTWKRMHTQSRTKQDTNSFCCSHQMRFCINCAAQQTPQTLNNGRRWAPETVSFAHHAHRCGSKHLLTRKRISTARSNKQQQHFVSWRRIADSTEENMYLDAYTLEANEHMLQAELFTMRCRYLHRYSPFHCVTRSFSLCSLRVAYVFHAYMLFIWEWRDRETKRERERDSCRVSQWSQELLYAATAAHIKYNLIQWLLVSSYTSVKLSARWSFVFPHFYFFDRYLYVLRPFKKEFQNVLPYIRIHTRQNTSVCFFTLYISFSRGYI